MKISTRGRYALRLMIDLAQNKEQGNISLKDVARQSVMLTTILPFGLSLLVIVFIMMMFTRQAGGGGNAKMMNFGKSTRAVHLIR